MTAEGERQIVGLLVEIRDLLARPMSTEGEADRPVCEHPQEARINFQAMGDKGEHFKCRACGQFVRPSTIT